MSFFLFFIPFLLKSCLIAGLAYRTVNLLTAVFCPYKNKQWHYFGAYKLACKHAVKLNLSNIVNTPI